MSVFRFRTRSGREILLVPEHAIHPLDDDARRHGPLHEHPLARGAIARAEDEWPTTADAVVIDLGVAAMPGRATWGPDDTMPDSWDEIPRLADLGSGRADPSQEDERPRLVPLVLPPSIDPSNDPPQPPGWLSIELVDDRGRPFGGTELTLVHCDGRRDRVVCDHAGRFHTPAVPLPGPVRIEWPVTIARTGPPPLAMDGFVVQADDLRVALRPEAPTVLTTIDRHYRFVVEPVAFSFDFEEVTFANERAVLLPETPLEHRLDRPQKVVRGLSAIAAVVAFARANPEHALLVVGHADTVGGGSSDTAIATARAENVRRYLAGDLEGWASHCMTVYAIEDVQRVLAWASRTFAWDCDPGPCDNDLGDQTKAALARFRSRHASTFGSTASAGAAIDVRDWRAFADLYDAALERILRSDAPTPRGGLRWLPPGAVGCGAEHPRRSVPGAAAGGTDRRVELVFADPDTVARLDGIDPVVAIHDARNPLRYIPLDPQRALFVIKGQFFDPITGKDAPLPRHRWALVQAATVILESDASDANGVSTILEPDTALPAGECELRLVPIVAGRPDSSVYTTRPEAWIDVTTKEWVAPDQIADGSYCLIATQKLLRVPSWSSKTKAELGGGFVAAPPHSAAFLQTGVLAAEPFGTRDAPWVIQIDHGWLRTHVQLRYYDPIARADKSVPPGVLLLAMIGVTAVVGGSSVVLPNGSIYMLSAGVKASLEKLYYQFELPHETSFRYADGAMSTAERFDTERFATEYLLPVAWGGPEHSAWLGPGDPTAASRKPFAERRHAGESKAAPICFHLDDLVLTHMSDQPICKNGAGGFDLPSQRVCILDAMMAIRDQASNALGPVPYSTTVLNGFPLAAEEAYHVRGQGLERITRAVDYEGVLFEVGVQRVRGAMGLNPFVGARSACESQGIREDHYEAHLLDTRWLRHTVRGTHAKLAHLLIYVPGFVHAPKADDAPDGSNAARTVALPRVEHLLYDAARIWDQTHPAHGDPKSPAKDYVIVPRAGLTADTTAIRVRHHFAVRVGANRVETARVLAGTTTLGIEIHPQAGRATGGDPMHLYLVDGLMIEAPPVNPHPRAKPPFAFEPNGPVRQDRIDAVEGQPNTLAHELGHSIGLPDEYCENVRAGHDADGLIAAFASEPRPYGHDLMSMMRENRVPRLRYHWERVRNLTALAGLQRVTHWSRVEAPFVPQYVTGGRRLEYALPPGVLGFGPDPSPWAAKHGKVGRGEVHLFLAGDDESTRGPIITEPEDGILDTPFDGVLVYNPKYWFSFAAGILESSAWNLMYEDFARDFYVRRRAPRFVIHSSGPFLRKVLVVLQPRFEFAPKASESQTAADADIRVVARIGGDRELTEGSPDLLTIRKRDVGMFLMRYAIRPTAEVFATRNNAKLVPEDLDEINQWFALAVGRQTTLDAL